MVKNLRKLKHQNLGIQHPYQKKPQHQPVSLHLPLSDVGYHQELKFEAREEVGNMA